MKGGIGESWRLAAGLSPPLARDRPRRRNLCPARLAYDTWEPEADERKPRSGLRINAQIEFDTSVPDDSDHFLAQGKLLVFAERRCRVTAGQGDAPLVLGKVPRANQNASSKGETWRSAHQA